MPSRLIQLKGMKINQLNGMKINAGGLLEFHELSSPRDRVIRPPRGLLSYPGTGLFWVATIASPSARVQNCTDAP
jgi:hypothetical protein